MELVAVANRPAEALAEAQIAVEEVAAASGRIAVVAMAVVGAAVELAAPAAGVAVTAKPGVAGSADTKGPQELGSPGSKNLLCRRLERQEIGVKSIAVGFALVVAGADFGKDCSGSFVVAGKPHRSAELG
jgi:hypothetical protein